MIDRDAQQLREDYLARLDSAIADLPWRVANDLRTGIAEELDGLDAAGLHQRIAQLGDPVQVAAAARDEEEANPSPIIVVAPATPAAPSPKPPMVDTKGFAIAGALVLGAGSFLVPFGGWVIGVGLVTSSRFWRRWEKTVAILLPLAVAVLLFFVSLAGTLLQAPSDGAGANPLGQQGNGGFFAPGAGANPLLPSGLDLWHSSILIAVLAVPVGALWLLWRLRGRVRPFERR
ncbi:hypothetical protein [uncultured Microbacterium sp.]|uniref:hypothetical protein n=1 Tax=uncultured Microbacterium sp. TaxID=191216 RepID=UPI0025F3E317|nr:hypothetical protein [uncultured Microbacterium sp.]